MQIDQILASFKYFDGNYKRKQIDAALKQQAEITPHLIKVLEQVSGDPKKYILDLNYYAHTYALMLLGHFRETQAHDVIIELFSLPGEIPFDLFGDLVTEDLSIILLRTSGGETERIQQLVLNPKANDSCRSAAIETLTYAAITEMVPREYVLTFLDRLFTESEPEPGSFFYNQLVYSALDLYGTELMPQIISVYDRKMLSPYADGLEYIQKEFLKGKEYCFNLAQERLESKSLDDIHKSMAWWACFDKEKKKSKSPSKKTQKTSPKSKKTGTKKKKTFWDL